MNIKRRCNKAGCNSYISIAETYCKEHSNHNHKRYEQIRTSTIEGREYKYFYSTKEWKSLRYQVLLDAGFICELCNEREATIGDHIIPTKVRWDLRLDRKNVQAVCKECHNKKTANDKIEYGI